MWHLLSPLVELPRGDEPSPSVAVPEVTGLPPGVVLHADNLEDVAPFEAYGCVLARNGGIVIGIVVKKSLQKQLGERTSDWVLPSNRQTGEKEMFYSVYLFIPLLFFLLQLRELPLYPGDEHTTFVWRFLTCVGVIFEKWRRSQE